MRLAIGLMLATLAAILQGAIVARIADGPRPDLALLVVLAWSMLRGVTEGAVAGLTAGRALDLLSAAPFGLHTGLFGPDRCRRGPRRGEPFRGSLPLTVLAAALAALLLHGGGLLILQASGQQAVGFVRLPASSPCQRSCSTHCCDAARFLACAALGSGARGLAAAATVAGGHGSQALATVRLVSCSRSAALVVYGVAVIHSATCGPDCAGLFPPSSWAVRQMAYAAVPGSCCSPCSRSLTTRSIAHKPIPLGGGLLCLMIVLLLGRGHEEFGAHAGFPCLFSTFSRRRSRKSRWCWRWHAG